MYVLLNALNRNLSEIQVNTFSFITIKGTLQIFFVRSAPIFTHFNGENEKNWFWLVLVFDVKVPLL